MPGGRYYDPNDPNMDSQSQPQQMEDADQEQMRSLNASLQSQPWYRQWRASHPGVLSDANQSNLTGILRQNGYRVPQGLRVDHTGNIVPEPGVPGWKFALLASEMIAPMFLPATLPAVAAGAGASAGAGAGASALPVIGAGLAPASYVVPSAVLPGIGGIGAAGVGTAGAGLASSSYVVPSAALPAGGGMSGLSTAGLAPSSYVVPNAALPAAGGSGVPGAGAGMTTLDKVNTVGKGVNYVTDFFRNRSQGKANQEALNYQRAADIAKNKLLADQRAEDQEIARKKVERDQLQWDAQQAEIKRKADLEESRFAESEARKAPYRAGGMQTLARLNAGTQPTRTPYQSQFMGPR